MFTATLVFVLASGVGLANHLAGSGAAAALGETGYAAVGGNIEDEGSISGELIAVGGSALIAHASPTGSFVADSSSRGANIGLISYIVKEGDTISTIAAEFGVSINTILWENKLTARSIIRPGMKLSILPVDGVKHTVARGDTISTIARRYRVESEQILTYNSLSADDVLTIGDTIIIPDGAPLASASSRPPGGPARSLIDATGYFIMPTQGRRTQGLHRYNAVDLGGSDFCNSPISAAAAGTVISSLVGGWNGGYGNLIKISHPNGTVTLYAHNSQNLATVGATVSQGQVIALMGSTGNSTGCHVHFEVRGARNPFAG